MGKDPTKRKADLYCSYHKDHGHKTENCRTLKQFLEDLVEEGHLGEFVKKAAKDETTDPLAKKHGGEQRVADLIASLHGVLHRSEALKRTLSSGVHWGRDAQEGLLGRIYVLSLSVKGRRESSIRAKFHEKGPCRGRYPPQ